jgi:hypothetical protein
MTVDINKVIKKIAREKFSGQEIKQKGQSRLWYFPGAYYQILIEFQPSSWNKGTYLNVGLDFNWFPRDFFAFEFGDRLSEFKSFNDENQFQKEVEKMCDLALEKVEQYKLIFREKTGAADRLLKLKKELNEWDTFSIGVLFGFEGQPDKAIKYLHKISGDHYKLEYEIERAKIAKEYIKAIEQGNFMDKLSKVIQETKELKRVS